MKKVLSEINTLEQRIASTKSVKVEWFDALKGIGEGITSDGDTVFLNSNYIKSRKPQLLKKGEIVLCELKKNKDGSLYASEIK